MFTPYPPLLNTFGHWEYQEDVSIVNWFYCHYTYILSELTYNKTIHAYKLIHYSTDMNHPPEAITYPAIDDIRRAAEIYWALKLLDTTFVLYEPD